MKTKVFLIVLIGCVNLGFSQSDWELVKEEGPLKVYTRLKQGSDYLETKVAGKGKADINSVLAVMQDADNYYTFMPNCIESKKLQMKSDTAQVHYIVTEAPWPISDRDGVYEFDYNYYPDSNMVFVDFKALPTFMECDEDCIRVQHSEGYWKFIILPDNELFVEYVIYAHPAGNIPSWLANMSVIDLPLGTVTGAFERTLLPEYQGKHFSFID